ncbi:MULTISPECIES: DUF397 domain-containing protein [Thermomonosporaceae]|uniref:DUF397 domain-containing protein n=1 Tax=Thermomonosporaceae TaxID=2012 RepID=UPI00255AF3B0|nr:MULTISPECIES: DUF397 domain-containing protein [Thermomonosporaceae]MDL4774983.1 DUF397 domain-containing protein [Actinomadura xylanilytica]
MPSRVYRHPKRTCELDLNNTRWRKSSRSSDQGDQCVEVASTSGAMAVRDSKDAEGPILFIDHRDFQRLASAIKSL